MLKFILIVFLVFVVIYQVAKLLFKPLLYFYAGKARNSQYGKQEDSGKDGDLKVDFIPPKKGKRGSSSSGEYVDYEEIDS